MHAVSNVIRWRENRVSRLVRGRLSASQRRASDKIYRAGAEVTGDRALVPVDVFNG